MRKTEETEQNDEEMENVKIVFIFNEHQIIILIFLTLMMCEIITSFVRYSGNPNEMKRKDQKK